MDMNCEDEKVLASSSAEKLFDQIADLQKKDAWTIEQLWYEKTKAVIVSKTTIYFSKLTRRNPQISLTIGPVRKRRIQHGSQENS